MRNVFILIGVLVLVLLATTLAVIVDETEHVVVTLFGRPTAVHSEAGLHFKLPTPIQRVTRLDRRTLFTTTQDAELLTADKKNVMVSAYLSWRIVEPVTYLGAVRDRASAEARLTALVQSELGSALGDLPFTSLAPAGEGEGSLAELEQSVHQACQEVARQDYGIEVVSLGITRLNFPSQNETSVFARMRAERERIARGFRSQGKAEAQKIRAEADRERAEILASAEADSTRLRGKGEADAARIYAEAYSGYEDFYTFLRTLESYEKVLNEQTTLVLPADSPFLEVLMSRVPSTRGSDSGKAR